MKKKEESHFGGFFKVEREDSLFFYALLQSLIPLHIPCRHIKPTKEKRVSVEKLLFLHRETKVSTVGNQSFSTEKQ